MSNVEKTAWKIQASCPQGRVLTIDQALVVANVLEEAGLLAPAPQIIRTPEELEALDPDAVVISAENGASYYAKNLTERHTKTFLYVPAVVIATGTQVRAAREAMEQTNE